MRRLHLRVQVSRRNNALTLAHRILIKLKNEYVMEPHLPYLCLRQVVLIKSNGMLTDLIRQRSAGNWRRLCTLRPHRGMGCTQVRVLNACCATGTRISPVRSIRRRMPRDVSGTWAIHGRASQHARSSSPELPSQLLVHNLAHKSVHKLVQ